MFNIFFSYVVPFARHCFTLLLINSTHLTETGNIPLGYSTEVKLGSVDVGLEVPDEDEKPSDYKLIFKNLVEYLKRRDPTVTKLPIVFTLPKKVSVVQDFISQLCRKSGKDEFFG